MKLIIYIALASVLTSLSIYGQQEILPIYNGITNRYSNKIYQTKNFHTSIQPYNLNQTNSTFVDSTTTKNSLDILKSKFRNNQSNYFISPIGVSQFGINLTNSSINYTTATGALIQYSPSNKLTTEINYKYFVSEQPTYIDTSLFSNTVLPSIGRFGLIPSQSNGIHDIQGHLNYTPNRFFSFLLGKGNHFWGDGYRSFLLSDNASSYPFLRIESTFWNVKYTNLYSWHSDITTGMSQNKFSASHHLSWNIIEGLNFGLFETVIWAGQDTLINRGFDVNYINPVIFYRPVEYAQGSNDNSILGISLKGQIKKQHIIYGQLLLDEFLLAELRSNQNWWGNKYAIQLGYKNYQLFNNPKLSFLIERNIARPFTYSHITSTLNYGHLGQSLAHPLGANFKETVQQLSYKHNRWIFSQQANFISYGGDSTNTNNGGNIFLSYKTRDGEYGHEILQGEQHRIFLNKIKVEYRLIDAINLNAFAALTIRNENTPYKNVTDLFFNVGLKTQLWNSYTDY